MTPANNSIPSWLFTNNVANPKAEPETSTMAKKSFSTAPAAATTSVATPQELLSLVESFLQRNSYKKALEAFRKQTGTKSGATTPVTTLEDVYATWKSGQSKPSVAQTKDDSSDSDSSDDSSDSSSESDDDDEDMEDAPKPVSPAAGKQPLSLKRKAQSDSDSSSEDSSSDESSSDSESSDDEPKAKKQKTVPATAAKNDSSSDSDSSSDEDSSDSEEDKKAAHAKSTKKVVPAKDKSSSESDSGSDSSSSSSSSDESSDESSSESEAEVEAAVVAAKVPLPTSDSSSSDDSSSDSDAPASKAAALKKDASDSSVTLDNPPLPPNPTAADRKKANIPFSRIPKDIKVDPRFSSNAYVPMSYSQRAHEDLIITKGKGFTKEKNKKKKGSFRGGAIDITEKKGIYFD